MVMKGHSPPQVQMDRLAPTLKGLLGEKQVIETFPPLPDRSRSHLAGEGDKVQVGWLADPSFGRFHE
jgi:hypothetical protein